MEAGSSWWCAVQGQGAHFAAGGSPTRYKGEKKSVHSMGSQTLEKADKSCGISILGDAQGLAQPI